MCFIILYDIILQESSQEVANIDIIHQITKCYISLRSVQRFLDMIHFSNVGVLVNKQKEKD